MDKKIRVFLWSTTVFIFVGVFNIPFSSLGLAQGKGSSQSFRPEVGKKAATRYFAERNKLSSGQDENESRNGSRTPDSDVSSSSLQGVRYLGLHLGTYIDEEFYKWGKDPAHKKEGEVGRVTAGVSYRLGEWTHSMDLLLRVDFSSYQLSEGRPLKMSVLPLVTFPDANSGFPLYFGGGAGLGVFLKQIVDESPLSFDYQLIMGLRLFHLIREMGFSIEGGLKNHIHLLSDGQYSGVFVALGTVFNF